MAKKKEAFDVVLTSMPDEDTVVVTSTDLSEKKFENALKNAISVYDPENKQYSAFLNDTQSSETLTVERIDELSKNLQTKLSNILTVNAAIQTYINNNDLLGITYDAIEGNVNTEFKCVYKKFPDKRNKSKAVDNAKTVIDDFNQQINVRRLIRSAIPIAYAEGNYIMYLRKSNENYIVDYYPLGVAEISDYTANGKPIVLINIQKLKTALSKTMLKDRKRKPLFFDTQDDEVKNNYPEEVYQAFKNNETYARLDVEYCGVVRVGNMGRKYGVSPFLRALKPILMLETFDASDRTNAKAKSKKIIWEKLRKELLGPQFDRKAYAEMAYAHDNLMKAWRQKTVLVTTPAYVEDITYVEPKVEMTNIDTVNQYRNRVMAALGISFLNTDGTQTVSTANISLDQLMKNINKISEQIEDILRGWYRIVLTEANVDPEMCPDVHISASEMMSMEMKRTISNYLFTTLGASYDTAFSMVGMSVEDERQKRERENENGYSEIFAPRGTAFTSSGNSVTTPSNGGDEDEGKAGRPSSDEETEKQAYDKARNDAKKHQEGK